MRKLLAFPNAPAVVFMQALAQGVKVHSLPFYWSGGLQEGGRGSVGEEWWWWGEAR